MLTTSSVPEATTVFPRSFRARSAGDLDRTSIDVGGSGVGVGSREDESATALAQGSCCRGGVLEHPTDGDVLAGADIELAVAVR